MLGDVDTEVDGDVLGELETDVEVEPAVVGSFMYVPSGAIHCREATSLMYIPVGDCHCRAMLGYGYFWTNVECF